MKEEKYNVEGKTVYDILKPSKVSVSVMAILERQKMEAKMKAQSEEWAKQKNK